MLNRQRTQIGGCEHPKLPHVARIARRTIVALDLKATLEHAGGGPAGRLEGAMLLAGNSLPDAAVFDVRLVGWNQFAAR